MLRCRENSPVMVLHAHLYECFFFDMGVKLNIRLRCQCLRINFCLLGVITFRLTSVKEVVLYKNLRSAF